MSGRDRERPGMLGGTEGGRRPSGVPPNAAERKVGALGPKQRWSAKRKRDVALRMLRGEPVDALSRELGVEVYRLEKWREEAMRGIEFSLKEREGDPLKSELDAAMRRIGELSMENELLRYRCEKKSPLAGRRSRK